jgi:hypothetical protein
LDITGGSIDRKTPERQSLSTSREGLNLNPDSLPIKITIKIKIKSLYENGSGVEHSPEGMLENSPAF